MSGPAYGTVFQLDLATGIETILHKFAGGSDGGYPTGGLIYEQGSLYGTTEGTEYLWTGTVFKLDLKTDHETVLYGGGYGSFAASGTLAYEGGTLYGTTYFGGNYDLGTVFSLEEATDDPTVLNSFAYIPGDGAYPAAGVIYYNGVL